MYKMTMNLSLLIFTIGLISCNSFSFNKNNSRKIDEEDSKLKKDSQQETSSKSFEVNEDCVIFLMPSDLEIKEMQNENSEDDYNEIIADITWYPGIASEYLDSIGIKIKMIDNQDILILKVSNGNSIKFKKNMIDGDMILFRKDTLPIISNAIDFNKEFTKNFFYK